MVLRRGAFEASKEGTESGRDHLRWGARLVGCDACFIVDCSVETTGSLDPLARG
jgi:hypothetical protein